MTLATVTLLFHALLVLFFSVRILLRDDLSPPARLAWFIVLNVLPYIGSLAYFLVGEIDIGRHAHQRHEEVSTRVRLNNTQFLGKPADINQLIHRIYRPAFQYAASVNQFFPVPGNRAQLMPDAQTTIAQMVADMDSARQSIHVLYYIWLDDNTGNAIAEALIRAAKRGISCRAMADGLGSRALIRSELWQKMREAGVRLSVALPFNRLLQTLLTSRIDLRNHRKITVIDSRISYCGSRNCADPEFLIKPKYAPWVDVMLRFEGPVTAQNQLLFASDWEQATGERLDSLQLNTKPCENGFPALVTGMGPTGRSKATPHLYTSLLACAEHSLTLTTPYFVPDETVFEALCSAAHRGVAVTLIFPHKNDSWIVAAASHSFYHRLLDAGCKIYEYQGGLLHAKILTVDGQLSLIGSSNLDLRSFDLNFENNILLQDAQITQMLDQRQHHYIASSTRVELHQVLAWPVLRRVWNNIIATLGPVL